MDDNDNSFIFSIVMAIYNTQEYLKEAIDSIIYQSLDFKENTQLVLVNDGSEDDSLDIALEYQKKFPNNIVVLSQENQGQASARNNGLDYVKGKYVNFFDSDDKLSETTLEEVNNFFKLHEESIDVVTVKIIEFERSTKAHPLNFRFKCDRVIDLVKEPGNPQLSVSSSFIKNSAINNQRFKTNLVGSEDTNFINRILLEKKAYGVLENPTYYYRKRMDNSSSVDSYIDMVGFYTDRLKYHFMDLIQYCLDKEGEVPEFIKYTLAYNIQWMVTPEVPNFDYKYQADVFMQYFKKVLSYLSIDALNSKLIRGPALRNYLISKYNDDIHCDFDLKRHDVFIRSKNRQLDRLGAHQFWIDIVELKDNHLNISGALNSLFDSDHISIKAVRKDKNGNTFIYGAKKVDYTARSNLLFLSETIQYKYNFDLSVPLDEDIEYEIGIKVMYYKNGNTLDFKKGNVVTKFLSIGFRRHSPISKYCNYFVKDSKIVYFEDNKFYVENYKYSKMISHEKNTLKTIKEANIPNFMNILWIRGLALLLYPIFKYKNRNKKTYLFMDRVDKADDNAEHLFRYALNQNDNINKYYIISEDCSDYSRVNKELKNVVKFASLKHKLLFLFADKVISSNPDDGVVNPFVVEGKTLVYSNSSEIPKYYIRHGVTQGNMSTWLKKYDKNISLLLTSSSLERDSFFDAGYGYDKDRIQVLGLPRFDNLRNDNVKKQILIIPTWRNYLVGSKDIFLKSPYFNSLNELLNDDDLIDFVEKQGYEIVLKPHPNLERTIKNTNERFIDLFDIHDKIRVSNEGDYQKLFRESAIMITDFSSVFFDFGYLKKPIIYYQPNDDHPFKGGYFDYNTMGFGEVTKNLLDLKSKIKYYIESDCKIEQIYEDRINNFFDNIDRNNCKRVYDWIDSH
ncbi:CDP-glycerol glycerophosphotransferase family protein [Methanobrevibacter sp. YE315]|uniref:bifunctional glycosyltransferase/CDP-glycerol:glycerophosphate glycerophosphotransferase n=1 Tax=Methanobrevibacter sp. YE315 TaxID=1609968 RepID=UPI000836A13D|nr:CDP-glycerol glycerophosphotransferase family protein [Methanobrevibacter sp. YE315]